jgi:hypothetical protein
MNRNTLLAVLIVCATVLANQGMATPLRTSAEEFYKLSRPGIPAVGAATTINCSNVASVSSADLGANKRFVIMCTDASYLRFGATAPTAAAGDMIIPNGSWYEFGTPDSAFYVACKNVTSDAACYYMEER